MYRLEAAWALPLFLATPGVAVLPLCGVLLSTLVGARGLVRGKAASFFGVFSRMLAFVAATLIVPAVHMEPLVYAAAGLHMLGVAVICALFALRATSA